MVGIDQIKTNKQCLIIVDESDAIMLADPVKFYKQTKAANTQVVCLTVTPDDGFADGNEIKLIDLMGYKRVKTGEVKDMVAPQINARESFKTAYDIMTEVK